MKKSHKITYWIATLWLALGMTSTGIVQVIGMDEEVARITELGYPAYMITMLGVLKLLGVIAVLVPRFPLIKEWAYAGFFFNIIGAIYSHFAAQSNPADFFGPTLLLVLIIVSWYFRPADRKLTPSS